MGSFLTPLIFQNLDDGRSFVIMVPFTYRVREDEYITVPVGFVTDLASIPLILWNIFPKLGKYNKAAVIHDYLYVLGGKYQYTEGDDGPCYRLYSKKEVDGIFLDAMQQLGVGNPRRYLMWKAVSLFGRGNFHKV